MVIGESIHFRIGPTFPTPKATGERGSSEKQVELGQEPPGAGLSTEQCDSRTSIGWDASEREIVSSNAILGKVNRQVI